MRSIWGALVWGVGWGALWAVHRRAVACSLHPTGALGCAFSEALQEKLARWVERGTTCGEQVE